MANDDDFINQIFSSVTLPEVKYIHGTNDGDKHMEYTTEKTVVTSEQQIESSHVVITHSHSEHHEYFENQEHHGSFENHHHETFAAVDHLEHHGSESDMSKHEHQDNELMNDVFNRPTNDTFRVENGIPESDAESRSQHNGEDEDDHHLHHHHEIHTDHQNEHHIHHEEHQENHNHHDEDHEKSGMLNLLPQKTEQHDSVIQELRNKHTRSLSESSTSSNSTLKNEHVHTTEHVESHIEIETHHGNSNGESVHHEIVNTHITAPLEPEPDYESEHEIVVHHDTQHIPQVHVEQASSQHSRKSSISSVQSHHSTRSQQSNHSTQSHGSRQSHHSNHSHQSHHSHHSKASSRHEPPSRTSRASSVSTLVSEKQVPIVVHHPTHEPESHEHNYDHHTDDEMKSFFTSKIEADGKGIYKIRGYGTGSRSGTNSQRSSISSYNDQFEHHEHNYHHGIGNQHVIIEDNYKPPQKPPQRNIHHLHQTPGEIDDQPIESVGQLQKMFGGQKTSSRHNSSSTHKSNKRNSNVSTTSRSTVRSDRNGHKQHVPERKNTATTDSRRSSVASQNSVSSNTSFPVVKNGFDSIRVVRHVRSYKEYLDTWSRKEMEEAAETEAKNARGKVKPEPIPRPRYSISARSGYPKVAVPSLQSAKTNTFVSSNQSIEQKRRSIRPSEKVNEHGLYGKLDKSTSYHTLPDIDKYYQRNSINAIQEEDENENNTSRRHSRYSRQSHGSVKSLEKNKPVKEGAHSITYPQDYDEIDVDISKLKSVFEQNDKVSSSRRSSNSTIISKASSKKNRRDSHDSNSTLEEKHENQLNSSNGTHTIHQDSHTVHRRHYEVLTTVPLRYL